MDTSGAGPGPDWTRADWARFYCGQQGLALVAIPEGSKGPRSTGWNRPGGYFTDPIQAEAHWRRYPRQNMGAVLAPSGTTTFDVDHPEWAAAALSAVGLDIEEFLTAGAAIEGNPEKAKRVFAAPPGVELGLRKLMWPDPENPRDLVTVFELRAGAVQDVLPPSIHPVTLKPYRWLEGRAPWELGAVPPVPAPLLNLWQHWDELLPAMEAACPWRRSPEAPLRPKRTGAADATPDEWDAVRQELLQHLDLDAVLDKIGAERRTARTYLCPFHKERSPSFWVFDTGQGCLKWVCAHGDAPVGFRSARGWSCGDALDLVAYGRGVSVGKATVELAREMEIPLPLTDDPGLPEPPPETASEGGEDWGAAAVPAAEAPATAEAVVETPVRAGRTVDPFPVEVLPQPLQCFVSEVARSLPCPLDFVAVPLLAAMGAAIGTSREIRAKAGWEEGPRLYCGVVAEPGSKKSPALARVLKPLMRRQGQMKTDYEARKEQFRLELGAYEQELAIWKEAVRKAAKSGGPAGEQPVKPEEPVMPQLVANDATLEAIAMLLHHNPRGLLFFRDELSGWVGSMDAYRGGKGADREAWLSFWSGQPHVVNRKSSKEPIVLANPFLCVTGCIPPEVLGELADQKGREDGFIHRLLLAYPDPVPLEWNDAGMDPEVIAGYERVLAKLWALQPETGWEGESRPVVLEMTPAGKRVWDRWINRHYAERDGADFPPNLRGPWAKMEGYFLRVALILHLCRFVCREAEDEQVDDWSITGATAVMEYFKSHARRVYAGLNAPEEERRVLQLVHWVEKRGGKASVREAVRANVAGVRNAEQGLKLFRSAQKWGHGRLERQERNSWVFTVNPTPDS